MLYGLSGIAAFAPFGESFGDLPLGKAPLVQYT